MDILYELPAGYELCKDVTALYRLKKRKKVWNDENIEPIYGNVVYVFSHIKNGYYGKIVSRYLPIRILEKYIKLKLLYYRP